MVDLAKLRKKAKGKREPATVEQEVPPIGHKLPDHPETPVPEAARAEHDSTPVPSSGEDRPAAVMDAASPRAGSKLDRFKQDAGRLRQRVEEESELPVESAGSYLELLTFRLNDENYAVEIENIVELVPPRSTTRVPNAGDSVIGITSLRGTIVTVIDLRRKLGHPPQAGPTADARMIVVEHDGESSGFVVDRVSRVIKLDPSKIENHPVVSATEQSETIRGVFQQPGGLTILLDLKRVLG